MRRGRAGVVAIVAALGLIAVDPILHRGAARAASCAVWSVSSEDDVTSHNLTASACSSAADDSTAVGFQCSDRPQLRYYPMTDDPTLNLKRGMRVAVTFGVDPDSVVETMRYDEVNGVFAATIKNGDPVLVLLQSGGPLVVSSEALGSHTFRLLGSTAALATVLARCGRHLPKVPDPPPVVSQ